MEIVIKPNKRPKVKPTDDNELGFGRIFTDHMFSMKWNEKDGWHDAMIGKYHKFVLDPAAFVLHYGQGIFEGMKAYYRSPRCFSLFRPKDNIARFNRSARRMVMPEVDEWFFLRALLELVKADFGWIPKTRGCSLYIRPTMIATEAGLGVRPAKEYFFYIILSPVGPYFKTGFNPAAIYVSDKYARAADGGVGEAKTSGNYAASLLAAKEAGELGYNQVLWLDAKHHKYIEEVGAMNIFFVRRANGACRIETPPLGGTILPGVTRASVLKLASHLDFQTKEKRLRITEVIHEIKKGMITEVFGSGTAAVITPVGKLFYRGEDIVINENKVGPVTQVLYDELTAIQYGEKDDWFGWVNTYIF